jgi:hypothetical protein
MEAPISELQPPVVSGHPAPAPPSATSQESPAADPGTAYVHQKPRQWMIDVNTREQKFVDVLISLATGALILPPLLLQTYLGVREEPLAIFLDEKVYGSWLCLLLSIVSGVAFHYWSAKWVRHAWGQPVRIKEAQLEKVMDGIFWSQIVLFIGGLVLFLLYMRTV